MDMFTVLLILTINSYNYGTAIETIEVNNMVECRRIGEVWKHQDINTRNTKTMNYICVARKNKELK